MDEIYNDVLMWSEHCDAYFHDIVSWMAQFKQKYWADYIAIFAKCNYIIEGTDPSLWLAG